MTGPGGAAVAALGVAVALVGTLTGHAAVNARRWLRRPPSRPAEVAGAVAVLLPVRDEAHQIAGCLRSVLAQRGVPGLSIVVLDDGSADGTADVVAGVAAGDPRVRLVTGAPLPAGWLGKPHACHQLARYADPAARVLVFLDADVVLAPHAVAAAVALLDQSGVDLLSPYPRIVATGPGQRLVQPLLQWSWLTFLPLAAVERSARPALSAAGGQLLVVSAAGYRRAGGHAAVRDRVLEDVELARAVKRAGGRVALADGSGLAECRMYRSWPELVAGYTKSLWASFGSRSGAVAVSLLLGGLYLAPPLAGLTGAALWLAGAAERNGAGPDRTAHPGGGSGPAGWSWLDGSTRTFSCLALLGAAGYLLAVAGRAVSARATGGRVWPDALGQPASIALFVWLVARSHRHHRRGRLSWKGRPVWTGR